MQLARQRHRPGQAARSVITGVGNAVYGMVTLSADGASVTYRHGGSESDVGQLHVHRERRRGNGHGDRRNHRHARQRPTGRALHGRRPGRRGVDEQFSYQFANDRSGGRTLSRIRGWRGQRSRCGLLSKDKSEVTYTHDGSETTSGQLHVYVVSDGTRPRPPGRSRSR